VVDKGHIELEGIPPKEWESYTDILSSNFINLRKENEDSIIWSRNKKMAYTQSIWATSLWQRLFLKEKENSGGRMCGKLMHTCKN
jgi:hypothetical protein